MAETATAKIRPLAHGHAAPHAPLVRRPRHRTGPPRAARPHARDRQGAGPRRVQEPRRARRRRCARTRRRRSGARIPARTSRRSAASPRGRSSTCATSMATRSSRPAPGRRRCAPSAPASHAVDAGDERARRQRLLPGAPARPPRRDRTARWASAFSPTRPSPASMRAPSTGRSASRSSISTFTTATARRISSGPTRTCSTARRTRCRCSPAPGRLSETGVGNIFNAPLRAGDGGERFREAVESRILAGAAQLRPRSRPDLGGLRRAPGRSARQPASGGGRFHVGDGEARRTRRGSTAAAVSCRCSKAATI